MSWLYVFLGGGLGSICRFGLSKLFPYHNGFPWATFIANLIACLVLGYFIGENVHKPWNESTKLIWMTGFCGGFSTFSTFSAETFKILQSTNFFLASLYIMLSVLICLFAIFLGYQLAKYA